MAEEPKQEKKIIVDEDWKKEAQREKEILAAQEADEKKKAAQGRKAAGPLPEGNFAALVSMLATQALFALGLIQVQGQQQRDADLDLAKYNIDMLETLEQKTKGNLMPEEQQALKHTLADLRMGYVTVADQLGSRQ